MKKHREYHKEFRLDGILYRFNVIDTNVDIELVGGKFADGSSTTFHEDSFFPNCTPCGVNNKTKNPTKIVRAFAKVLIEYIYEFSPSILSFSAWEENRRNIYYKLMKQSLPRNYHFYNHDGKFFVTKR